MKSRITLLAFVSLLWTASLVSATPASPANELATPEPAFFAPAVTDAEASPCPDDASTPELAIFAPAPSQNVSNYDYCGMCGKDPCRGVLRGTICGYDYNTGRYKRCEMLYGDECTSEQRVVCYCYSEDIP